MKKYFNTSFYSNTSLLFEIMFYNKMKYFSDGKNGWKIALRTGMSFFKFYPVVPIITNVKKDLLHIGKNY